MVHDVIISSTVSVYHNPLVNTAEQKKLLGVVGADLPVSKLSDVFKPHELGPNGYAFLSKIFFIATVSLKTISVTENGFVSIHPEHRMKYNGVLRKNYRSTLITYVENLRDIDG